ncbi:hypothetical protein [Arenibacter echinorum]|uniref:Uncharacterized protein n=1 Tax=Arenibacter echinorum TaxID=440515 RepID=A0A327R837_9FLAO|nr:hypothetical protein [Arenibacter echinorum]RAJ12315.1 hypothetical protein LV92_01548 [Arenibacter echinorum]
MVSRTLIIIAIILLSCKNNDLDNGALQAGSFNIEKDLLLVQYDCKTDVDDLHTIAAFVTLMSDPNFSKINYHAVAGTYGIQSGLYVPPNPLLELAFKDNWTDAHNNTQTAVEQVRSKITATLLNKGDVWIAEAGQSDFTAELIKSIQANLPEINTSENIHVVQHSDWNEKSTSPEDLEFVKKNTDYHKIPDGNVVGNGTPGFLSAEYTQWKDKITNPKLIEVWELAIEISNEYNGKDGRYNNKAISQGGIDFSDLSEVCWILGINDIKDTAEFFNIYSN